MEGPSGAIVRFDSSTDKPCDGAITWCPECSGATWKLVSLNPLTLSPSIACREHPVEHHGFIREGKWVKA
jgi:hypothetical protein